MCDHQEALAIVVLLWTDKDFMPVWFQPSTPKLLPAQTPKAGGCASWTNADYWQGYWLLAGGATWLTWLDFGDLKNVITCPSAPVPRAINAEQKYFLRRVNRLEMGASALRAGLLSTYSLAPTQARPRSLVEQWIHFTLIRTQWHQQITKHHRHNVVCIWSGPHIIRDLLQCRLREALKTVKVKTFLPKVLGWGGTGGAWGLGDLYLNLH